MRSYHRNENVAWLVLMVVGALCVIALAVVGIWKYAEYRAKCTDNGGHWERYNCHNVTNVYYDANGFIHVDTSEHCDEKCVSASAEAR